MSSQPLLDPVLAALLRANRARVVPFAGAGASVAAGLPSAKRLTVMIGSAARERGMQMALPGEFNAVCAEVSAAFGHDELQRIVSEIVGGVTVSPTPLLTRIAHAASQIVVTTNYDYGIEAAAVAIGRSPVTLHPRSAIAAGAPETGELYVVHIHGVHDDPPSIVLPGQSMEALKEDVPFQTVLRGLLAPHFVLYLGYSFPDGDEYLPGEIEWIRDNLADAGEHALLLPRHEYEDRREQLAELGKSVRVFTFDASRDFDAVQQAALTIAPSREAVATMVEAIVGGEADDNFATPPILRDEIDGEAEKRQTRAVMARLGIGDEGFVDPMDLVTAGRSVVIAEPGMGKTQLLLHLGKTCQGFAPLYLPAKALAAELSDGRDPSSALAMALREASAFDNATPVPSVENMAGTTSYALLIDALDEVRPEGRAALVRALRELEALFPHYAFVVTTRPLLERTHAEELHTAGFTIYRIVLDEMWGSSYLREKRGIPESTLTELFERLPRARDLLQIPLYARLIGDRLAEGVEALPDTALKLITEVGVGDAIRREAGKQVVPADELYHYLQTLALALELRALNETSLEDALKLPAPPQLSSEETRALLVEQALLKDLPDRISFQTVTIQEGLAAEALLSIDDPLAAFEEVAVAEVAGKRVIRSGIDHTVDLFFENVPAELRESLRALDEVRWARTQSASINSDEARDTLEVIWRHFEERRNWIDSDGGRELRDARSAVERIARQYPELVNEMRPRLLEALASDEETQRGNAIFYLSQAPFDDATRDHVALRIHDANSVVRRFASSAIGDHKEYGLRDALADAYREETDELAASELAHALLALADEETRLETVRVLISNQAAWHRISYMAEGLPLSELLTILDETGIQDDDGRALERAIERFGPDDWNEELVRRLVALLVRSSQHSYYRFREPKLLRELVERFPDAALIGAESTADANPSFQDMTMLCAVPRDLLQKATGGPLGDQIQLMLDLYVDRPPATHSPPIAATSQLPNLSEWIRDKKLSTERCPTRDTVLRGLLDQVDDLSPEERESLKQAVTAWWPPEPLADHVGTDGKTGAAPPCLSAALAGSAALDLDLPIERWIELLKVNALWFHSTAAEWMAKNYVQDAEEEVIAHIAAIGDEYLLSLALRALPALSERVAIAFAEAVLRIGDENLSFHLDRLREEGRLDALRLIADSGTSEILRRSALRELARAGDLPAQRQELTAMQNDLQANPRAYEDRGLEWHANIREDVLPELGELLRIVSRTWSPSESQIGRTLVAAVTAIGSEDGLPIYDRLMNDDKAIGGSFYWYEYDRLRRHIATGRVLERLPADLDALAARLEVLGWRSAHDVVGDTQ